MKAFYTGFLMATAILYMSALRPNLSAQSYLYANNAGSCFAGPLVNNNLYLYQIDTSTGAVVTYGIPDECDGRGIAKVGNYLYFTTSNSNAIHCFDLSLGTECPDLDTIAGSSGGLASLAYDGANLWVQDYPGFVQFTKTVFKYNLKTKQVTDTITMGNCDGNGCDGLEFFEVPGLFGGLGRLIANHSDHTGPYDVLDITGHPVPGGASYINPGSNPTGIAWDGRYFYTADIYKTIIYKWNSSGKSAGSIALSGYDPDAPPVIEDLTSELSPSPPCDQPPNTTMVAWYPFDELKGTTSANLASGSNGTQVNGPLGIADGQVAGAARFNGIDQYVTSPGFIATNFGPAKCTIAGAYSSCPANFSIDVWVRTSVDAVTNEMVLLDRRAGEDAAIRGYSLFLEPEPYIRGTFRIGLQLADGGTSPGYSNYLSPAIILPCDPRFCLPVWHHLAVTVQRSSAQGITWYYDGVCLGYSGCMTSDPTDRMGSLVSTRSLIIGTNIAVPIPPVGFFAGDLDELEIHNRVLTPQEILDIFYSGIREGGKCKP